MNAAVLEGCQIGGMQKEEITFALLCRGVDLEAKEVFLQYGPSANQVCG